jgi:uncharacterized membrane protein
MQLYDIVLTIHILSATVLFGTGLGIAFFFFCANVQNDIAIRLAAAKTTVLADFLFTLPAVILQPLTGVWLAHMAGYRGNEKWLLITYALYLLVGACWVPVVWIQIRLRNMLKQSLETGAPLPDTYARLFRLWFMLGWPAFLGLVGVFFLMVAKPA